MLGNWFGNLPERGCPDKFDLKNDLSAFTTNHICEKTTSDCEVVFQLQDFIEACLTDTLGFQHQDVPWIL